MAGRFNYFVIFAGMRTGSNFLEENLNDFSELHCYGEVFNPHFIGHAKQTELLGVSLRDRETDPFALLSRMCGDSERIPGFRFFHDHDPRIKLHCLADPACAKIILTRNPVETYVSLEIARLTGQWRLGDGKGAKTAQIRFEPEEFKRHLADRNGFQLELSRALQTSGQTAFYLDYHDIGQVDVLNGLARFLGIEEQKKSTSQTTKKQNPQPLSEKVSNYDEMSNALASIDQFNLSRTPNFEPSRGPSVPSYVTIAHLPLLFMPIKCGPVESIVTWMSELADVDGAEMNDRFTQKTLRNWKRQSGRHQCFSVVRHPVRRLHLAFAKHILLPGPDCYSDIRETLRKTRNINIPDSFPDQTYDRNAHRGAFLKFAEFVKSNLAAQTSIRVDAAWASQSEILKGIGQFIIPDHVFREDEIASDLAYLADKFGKESPDLQPETIDCPVSLAEIYDEEVEAAVRAAYQKDYMMFGFEPLGRDQAA